MFCLVCIVSCPAICFFTLSRLHRVPSLRFLPGTQINDASAKILCKLVNLWNVSLARCPITDITVEELAKNNQDLLRLDLSGCSRVGGSVARVAHLGSGLYVNRCLYRYLTKAARAGAPAPPI